MNSLVNQFSRPRHDLSQCPVQMRVGLRRACESHVRTKVVPAPSAHLTGLAVDTNFHSDPVTDFEVETGVDIRADSGDDTTGFVTEDEGFSNLESAVRTVEVVVDCKWSESCDFFFVFPVTSSKWILTVRSTHARHCHLDLHLIRLGLGDIPLFLLSFVSLCPFHFSSPATHPLHSPHHHAPLLDNRATVVKTNGNALTTLKSTAPWQTTAFWLFWLVLMLLGW